MVEELFSLVSRYTSMSKLADIERMGGKFES